MIPSLTSPLEVLLSSGGDTRLDLDPRTGRNRYGCLPRPSQVVPFGSCTSSSISQRGYAAALEMQRLICSAPDSVAEANRCATAIRGRLRELLALPEGVEVALAPSGTDVEMLTLALAADGGDRPIVNIVTGPREVGTGTPLAAAACHYDPLTPNGQTVVPGEPVDPRLASRVDVRTVELRTASGEMLPESEIDAAVIELVVEALEADAVVLLHIVAHSKTGVHAPSLMCVKRLKEISDDVVVVVDAAQGRFSRRGLRDVLQKDYLVLFTGSKFYGGPPFSGALLVPKKYHPHLRGLNQLPSGFRTYFSAAEMPETWPGFCKSLPREPNFGAILRWSAALAEMEAYYDAPSEARLQVLRLFEAEVPHVLGRSNNIHMLPIFPPVYDDQSERLLESKTTVFGFWITTSGRPMILGKEELKKLHSDLALDLSGIRHDRNQQVMSCQYHLGQPVELGSAGCILRIALGGALVTRVATDATIGETLDERLEWLREQLWGLRRKLECLVAFRSPADAAASAMEDLLAESHA